MDTIRPCFALFPFLGTNKLLLLSQGQKHTQGQTIEECQIVFTFDFV